jgi:hypothetical protein
VRKEEEDYINYSDYKHAYVRTSWDAAGDGWEEEEKCWVSTDWTETFLL